MAIHVTAGEPLMSYISLVDAAGAPVLGATFTTVLARDPNGAAFPVVVTEQGAGVYRMDGTTSLSSPTGEWYALVQANDPFASRFSETWDVSGTQPVSSTPTAAGGITRAEIRRMAARELGDLVTVQATDTGTESSIIAGVDLARERGAFDGMQVLCVAGNPANIGGLSTVTGSDYETRSISFAPPFPVLTGPGDQFDLYNRRGTGWLVTQYNDAITNAIQKAGEAHGALPYSLVVDEPFNRTAATVPIPQPFSYFTRVDFLRRDGTRKAIPPAFVDVDRTTREVTIRGRWAHELHGHAYRLVGAAKPAILTSDTDRTQLSVDWIVQEVVAILFGTDAASGATQGSRDRLFVMARQQADGRRPTVVTTFGPNTIRLD